MRLVLTLAFLLTSIAAVAQAQQQKVVVFPVEAIADSAKLERSEFLERYPGIDATLYGLSDEGWYVRYQHELLTYLYGPVDDLTYVRQQKKILEEIRLSLVLKNPSLSSSKIDIIRFDFNATPGSGQIGNPEAADNPYLIPDSNGDEAE